MKAKHYLLLKSFGYVIVLLFTAWFIFSKADEIDTFGWGFLAIFAPILTYLAFSSFKQAKTMREEDIAYAPPTDATASEQIGFYKRSLWMSLLAFTVLSIWTYLDLTDLESGTVERVSLWGPVAFLYETFGFWAAVLATPLLGILVILFFVKKMCTIEKDL